MCECVRAFLSVFVVEASTKGGWSVFGSVGTLFTYVFKTIVEMSHRCARGEYLCVCVYVCVFGVLFLSGRRDDTVFNREKSAGLFVPRKIRRE